MHYTFNCLKQTSTKQNHNLCYFIELHHTECVITSIAQDTIETFGSFSRERTQAFGKASDVEIGCPFCSEGPTIIKHKLFLNGKYSDWCLLPLSPINRHYNYFVSVLKWAAFASFVI